MHNSARATLSVVMTTYNSEKFVLETVHSILHQTWQEFIFIIADDGSTDGTMEILESVQDPRIVLIRGEHRGKPAALNLAVRRVESEFVAFIDHDDLAVPQRLHHQLEFLTNHADVGLLSSWYFLCNEHGRIRREIRPPVHHDAIEKEMTKQCCMRFPGLMMRNDLFLRYGYFDETLRDGTDDYEFFLRLLPHTRFHNLPEPLLLHRRHRHTFSYRVKHEQEASVLALATQYLQRRMMEPGGIPGELHFRLGLSEYYHGTMKRARQYFRQAEREGFRGIEFYRYIIPTYLGDSFFHRYRSVYNGLRLNF